MDFEFEGDWETAGYMELIDGRNAGVRLPFRFGGTFIGRSTKQHCTFRHREKLNGIIEQSQILVRMDKNGCWITDASSTNQTTLIRERSAKLYASDRESLAHPDDLILIQHEAFKTPPADRCWVQVFPGDLLSHCYGCWRMVF